MTSKTVWFSGVQDKEAFQKDLGNFLNGPLVKKLIEIIEREEDKLNRIELSPDSYDNPSWSHKQAYVNGERQALKLIKDLIKL